MTIDSVVWFLLFFVAVTPVAAATGQLETTGAGVDATVDGPAGTLAFLLWLAAGISYHTVLEWRVGKTLGKYLVDIRVTNEDGSPLSFRSSLVRNVTRLLDVLPFFYLLGSVALLLSDRNQRLGDRFGDTVVVR